MKLYSRRRIIFSAAVVGCFIALAAYGAGFYLGHGTETPQGASVASAEALAENNTVLAQQSDVQIAGAEHTRSGSVSALESAEQASPYLTTAAESASRYTMRSSISPQKRSA